MPLIRIPRAWEIPQHLATPEEVYLNRRRFFKQLGAAGLGLVAGPSLLGAEEGALYPAKRNPAYTLDRALSDEKVAASYNNFYEFTTDKEAVKEKVDK
ncbi:MAG: protein-methionine-sulfoxide reductase catalytic subunit MsrP, partial [Candidatus Latescibacteria bacterium]|nr:protein-methionine-sulfoxide reductase catalytic subunit MsrP [Candidatus Latescibacterota bacterium]